MQNTLIKFDTKEVDDYIVSDYFSRKINLYSIITDDVKKEYFVTYQIQDNDKIERISYEIYKTTDYWDLLILINSLDTISDMPYDFDTYTGSTDDFLNPYYNSIYSNSPLNAQRLQELKDEFYETKRISNEKFRYINVIRPSKMQDFLKLIKQKGFIW